MQNMISVESNTNIMVEEVNHLDKEALVTENYEEKIRAQVYSQRFNKITNPTSGMLRIMEGKKGGAFYVAQIQDETSKKVVIGIIIEYPDGTYSEIIKVKQSEFKDIFSQGFIKPDKNRYATKLPRVLKILLDYETVEMPIPIISLWKLINEKYRTIPVKKVKSTYSINEIYESIALYANSLALEQKEKYSFIAEGGLYKIPMPNMKEIAQYYGMTFRELISMLDMHGLLQKEHGRYQYAFKRNGEYYRAYAIKANIGIEEDSQEESDNHILDVEGAVAYMPVYKSLNQRIASSTKTPNSAKEEFSALTEENTEAAS